MGSSVDAAHQPVRAGSGAVLGDLDGRAGAALDHAGQALAGPAADHARPGQHLHRKWPREGGERWERRSAMTSRLRFFCALACAWLLALHAPAWAATPASRPRLVVLFVVDGLPQRQLEAVRGELAPDGFARFLKRGASFTQANYGYAFTVTAAGHATLVTGASPGRSGIIGNEWLDPATRQAVYCTSDPEFHYIGHATQPLDGTSPRNLQVETVGDVLKRVDARSKVIAVSGKDRGAILPAGHAGTAYMYMADEGQFASTTYYLQQHPAWVER